MDKEEILAKSRQENKNRDLEDAEAIIKGGKYGSVAVIFLATFFFLASLVCDKGMNWGMYAVAFIVYAVTRWYKYIKMRKTNDLLFAIGYTIAVLGFSAAEMYTLIVG